MRGDALGSPEEQVERSDIGDFEKNLLFCGTFGMRSSHGTSLSVYTRARSSQVW
jgi:hypothetical protein